MRTGWVCKSDGPRFRPDQRPKARAAKGVALTLTTVLIDVGIVPTGVVWRTCWHSPLLTPPIPRIGRGS